MPEISQNSYTNYNGLIISGGINVNTSGICQQETTLAAAESGEVATQNTSGTSTFTMSAASSLLASDIVDLIWLDGLRKDMVVESVDGVTVSLSGGTGDDVPAAETSVRIGRCVDLIDTVPGDSLVSMGFVFTGAGRMDLRASDASIIDYTLAANVPGGWMSGMGDNPIGSNVIDTIRACNHATTANTFKFGCGYNSGA